MIGYLLPVMGWVFGVAAALFCGAAATDDDIIMPVRVVFTLAGVFLTCVLIAWGISEVNAYDCRHNNVDCSKTTTVVIQGSR